MGKRTYIGLVLDRSGSMKSCREATLKGINTQIATIRKDAEEPGVDTFVSYYTFNRHVEPQYKCRPVNFLDDITQYEIGGDTALYDAVGQVIADFKAETDHNSPDNSYLLVIVTDGQEWPVGCSTHYTQRSLAKIIRECQDTGRWTFTYLGANQDLSAVAEGLSIPKGNVANYMSDMKGAATAFLSNSRQLDNYLKLRKRGVTQLKSFHSNEGKIADYTKVDMNTLPSDFDISKLVLEKSKPGDQTADLDAILKLRPEKEELPKSIFRSENNA